MKKSLVPILTVFLLLLLPQAVCANLHKVLADALTQTPSGSSFRLVFIQQLNNLQTQRQQRTEAAVLRHQVRRGETLGFIARKYGTSVEDLMRINNLANPHFIRERQILNLLTESPSEQAGLTKVTHPLRRGETVWDLSRRFQVGMESILRANNITDPRRMMAGQRLIIPGVAATTPTLSQRSATLLASRSDSRTAFLWPTSGQLSSGFGSRWGSFHYGIDIAAIVSTPILTIAAGMVTKAGWWPGFGKMVRIEHEDGWVSVYGHSSRIFVAAGQEVETGQKIATVGRTGNATGPHLQLEMIFNGAHQNPLKHLPAR
ncbi:MAG: Murein hydrolase activator NlpD [Syntrophomonadaceae bacterium]|nr:Murein hydrolase activator NlpD [Bacillota bacterium]